MKPNKIIICSLMLLVFLIAETPSIGQSLIKVSVYPDQFHGRKTANGNTYNKYNLTAAHKTKPLGSKIVLTNPANLNKVTVEVNDRGPYGKSSTLEISAEAARKLGISKSGYSEIHVGEIGVTTPIPEEHFTSRGVDNKSISSSLLKNYETGSSQIFGINLTAPAPGFAVQIMTLTTFENAAKAIADLQRKGNSNVLMRNKNGNYVILLGSYPDKSAAETVRKKLINRYKGAFIVTL